MELAGLSRGDLVLLPAQTACCQHQLCVVSKVAACIHLLPCQQHAGKPVVVSCERFLQQPFAALLSSSDLEPFAVLDATDIAGMEGDVRRPLFTQQVQVMPITCH